MIWTASRVQGTAKAKTNSKKAEGARCTTTAPNTKEIHIDVVAAPFVIPPHFQHGGGGGAAPAAAPMSPQQEAAVTQLATRSGVERMIREMQLIISPALTVRRCCYFRHLDFHPPPGHSFSLLRRVCVN